MLDAKEGKAAQALAELEDIAAHAMTPKIAADAQSAIDALHRPREAAPERGAIRILPLARQLVSGRQTVRTYIASAAVARVSFSLDGVELRRVERPPFSTTLDFGSVPERHSIRVVAFDRGGRDVGRDERVVNEAGETFWLRLVTPREGFAGGAVRVSMNVRVPAARRVQRVVVSWNAAERAVLTAAPWESTIDIPRAEVGVLRAVAELDDGRTSEDAVLLNAGMVDQANVQLVELPLTIVSRDGSAPPKIASDRITVREGKRVRRVEAIASASETPLTIGLLIDVSGSMQKTLPDVQEAAIRFLETTLAPRDRAFVVTFDTRARLVQPATSDVKLLRRQIMSIRPDGLTALHDAIVLGLLQFEGIKGRRAMIVFSDGVDIASHYAASDVAELARRVSVPIHIIASTPGVPAALSASSIAPSTAASDDELPRIARSTGGTAHTLDSLAALPAVYATIQAALAAQILAYVRTDPATRENEWRSVQIEVAGQDLDVYAPAGYYASW
jgi:VWFA-related protein